MAAPPTLAIDDRQPALRLFAAIFTMLTVLLITRAVTGHFPSALHRGAMAAVTLVPALLAVACMRSPWRLQTVLAGGVVTHTAHRAVGPPAIARVPLADIDAVEVVAASPVRIRLALRDGRRLDVSRPMGVRGPVKANVDLARPRAETIARALGTSVREA